MSVRLENMRRNPRGDWTMADVESLCREHHITCGPARGGSSHYKISHASQHTILTVPYKRPIKPVYIRALVKFTDAVISGS